MKFYLLEQPDWPTAEIDVLNQTISSKNGMYYIYDYNIPNKGFFRY